MELKFTNKGIENIIHAKNGIKLNLKGYAIYADDITENIKTLSDIDLDKVICKSKVNSINELCNNLYELNYIPSLEDTYVTNESTPQMAFRFGKYEIEVNKSQTDLSQFNVLNILIIGELFDEKSTYVLDMNKSYLAAIISNVKLDSNAKKIIFKVSFSDRNKDEIQSDLCVVDVAFNDFVEKEIMKDLTTVQMVDNYTLTPDSNNTDYSDTINKIVPGASDKVNQSPYSIILQDKTDKINVPWNVNPRVFVGVDNAIKKHDKPHIELSYGKLENDKFVTNAVNIQHNSNLGYFSINQNTGNRKIQVDILPDENKADYSAISANESFFKFDSHGSTYNPGTYSTFEFCNKNNTFGKSYYPIENVGLYRSSNNILSGNNNDNLFIESNNNSIGFCYGQSTLINSKNNLFKYDKGNQTEYSGSVFHNNVLIGTDKIYSTDIVHDKVTANNVTFIGKNTNSTYYVPSAKNIPSLDCVNSLPALVYNITDITHPISSRKEINYGYRSETFSSDFNIGHEALIGFNGLSITRYPYREFFYRECENIGDNTHEVYYYSDPFKQINNNYSVIFGNYNAYYGLKCLSSIVYKDDESELPGEITVNALTKYFNDGNKYNNVYYSYYNSAYFYNANNENLYKLYFYHSQDNIVEQTKVSADEGDFSLQKLMVVGNGRIKTNNAVKGHSPAEYASIKTNYSDDCVRLDLFSVEKDSYQLVHNNSNDKDSSYLNTSVWHFPGIFAVRANTPVTQKYAYNKSTGGNRLIASLNKYNLHNAIYTTKGLFVPLRRTSNDVYKLTFDSLRNLINGTYTVYPIHYDFQPLDNVRERMPKNFVYKANKNSTVVDIINYYNKFNYKINEKIGMFTFYVVNNNLNESITFEGFRNLGIGKSTLTATKTIKPGHCIKVVYMNNDINGCGGVMNFDYNK